MKKNTILSALAAATLVVGCNQNSDQSNASATNSPVAAAVPAANGDSNTGGTNVDNSKINTRDRDNTNLTALDQGNSDADVKTSASIRKMVVSSTNNFSTTAQNIKIITQNGKVTLRGPVMSDTEKTQIDGIAKSVAGDGNVENDLEVKANQ